MSYSLKMCTQYMVQAIFSSAYSTFIGGIFLSFHLIREKLRSFRLHVLVRFLLYVISFSTMFFLLTTNTYRWRELRLFGRQREALVSPNVQYLNKRNNRKTFSLTTVKAKVFHYVQCTEVEILVILYLNLRSCHLRLTLGLATLCSVSAVV
jgi:hypothetical protein